MKILVLKVALCNSLVYLVSVLLPHPSLSKSFDIFPRKLRIMDLVSCVSFLKTVLKYRFFIPQRKVSDLHGSAQASASPAEIYAKNKREAYSVPAAADAWTATAPRVPGMWHSSCHRRAKDQIPAWYLEILLRHWIPSRNLGFKGLWTAADKLKSFFFPSLYEHKELFFIAVVFFHLSKW